MATAQATAVKAITSSESLMATKNLLAALVSELCFSRNIFDSEAFSLKKIGNARFHALVRSNSEDADLLLRWMESGAFSALREGFLSMFMLGIYCDPSQPERLLEAWYFKVTSNGGFEVSRGSQSKKDTIANTPADVKQTISSFVRSVVAAGQEFPPLPRQRYVTMRLYYNPENPPPEDFQPSDDFKTCEDTLSWPFKPECFPLGSDYSTPHHSVDLRIKTCVPPREAALQEQETYLEPQDVLCNDEMWRTSDDDDDMPSSEDEVRDQLKLESFSQMHLKEEEEPSTPVHPTQELDTDQIIFFITHLSNYNYLEPISGGQIQDRLKMSPKDVEQVIIKLVELKMLVIKKNHGKQGMYMYQVLPENAHAAQSALRHYVPARGPGALDYRTATVSPSSTIAAESPIFQRASGSRNRVMAAATIVKPSSPAPHAMDIHIHRVSPSVLEGPLALNTSGDDMEGLASMMEDSLAVDKKPKPRRQGRYGITVAPNPQFGAVQTTSFKTTIVKTTSVKGKVAAQTRRNVTSRNHLKS